MSTDMASQSTSGGKSHIMCSVQAAKECTLGMRREMAFTQRVCRNTSRETKEWYKKTTVLMETLETKCRGKVCWICFQVILSIGGGCATRCCPTKFTCRGCTTNLFNKIADRDVFRKNRISEPRCHTCGTKQAEAVPYFVPSKDNIEQCNYYSIMWDTFSQVKLLENSTRRQDYVPIAKWRLELHHQMDNFNLDAGMFKKYSATISGKTSPPASQEVEEFQQVSETVSDASTEIEAASSLLSTINVSELDLDLAAYSSSSRSSDPLEISEDLLREVTSIIPLSTPDTQEDFSLDFTTLVEESYPMLMTAGPSSFAAVATPPPPPAQPAVTDETLHTQMVEQLKKEMLEERLQHLARMVEEQRRQNELKRERMESKRVVREEQERRLKEQSEQLRLLREEQKMLQARYEQELLESMTRAAKEQQQQPEEEVIAPPPPVDAALRRVTGERMEALLHEFLRREKQRPKMVGIRDRGSVPHSKALKRLGGGIRFAPPVPFTGRSMQENIMRVVADSVVNMFSGVYQAMMPEAALMEVDEDLGYGEEIDLYEAFRRRFA